MLSNLDVRFEFQYYLLIIVSFAAGTFLHRLCEHRWPNRGASVAAFPLSIFFLVAEILLSSGA